MQDFSDSAWERMTTPSALAQNNSEHPSPVTAVIDYASAVDVCPFGIVISDAAQPDQPIIFVNSAFTELTGYSFAESMGKNCRFLSGPDTDQGIKAEIRDAIARGLPFRREILNYRKDGTQFWNDLAINPMTDERGTITSFVGVQSDITALRRSYEMREESESQISRIVSHMPGYVFRRVVKPDGTTQYPNSRFDFANWSVEFAPFNAQNEGQVVHPDDREMLRSAVDRSIADVAPITLEFRTLRANGELRWYRTSSTPRREANGDVVWDGVGIDITREKTSEDRLAGIVENMPGYVFQRVRKPDGTIEFPYLSPSFGRMTGQTDGPLSAANLWKLVHPDDRESVRANTERSAASLSPFIAEYRLATFDKGDRWMRAYSSPHKETNGDVVWDCVAVDITPEKDIETRLKHLAHHDQLTGLANRTLLTDRLRAAIVATRQNRSQISLIHLLIVDFPEINETLGMDDGDAVLRSVSARINEVASRDRDAVVARTGNCEFAILRQGAVVADEANEFVDALMRNVTQPILLGNDSIAIEACAGAATFLRPDLKHLSADAAATEMLKRVAIAASAAAKVGAGAHRLYDEDLDHRTRHRMMLRHSMRHAIADDQFELHYQPLVDLQSGRIVSAEALIRWRHPELGLLRPEFFISLAEESGLIGALGEWVMLRAMRQLKEWDSNGINLPKLAINVSAIQIKIPDFVDTVRRVLAETAADARRFELELTEGTLLERSLESVSVLAELRLLGFELVIDDFGAGHSSFQYLRNFPVNKLKIDQIFVRQLAAESNDALIIRAIASLARSLKLGLVAEGIETMEQREFLKDQGVAVGQGYYFSIPLTAEDLGWMVSNEVVLPMSPTQDLTRLLGAARGRR